MQGFAPIVKFSGRCLLLAPIFRAPLRIAVSMEHFTDIVVEGLQHVFSLLGGSPFRGGASGGTANWRGGPPGRGGAPPMGRGGLPGRGPTSYDKESRGERNDRDGYHGYDADRFDDLNSGML